jgi:CheY-like chemotaxis protein
MSTGTLRASASEHRLILRAELHHGDQPIDVCYAFDIKTTSVFVASDAIVDVGSEVSLRLSFPKLLDPVDLIACVESHTPPSGPGVPAGMRLEFEPAPLLTALIERAADTRLLAQSCRVLLVEDNGFIRDMFECGMRVFFETRGAYSLDHAETVDAAWQRLLDRHYDVAIVDYYLPLDTGAQLIERVRANPQLAGLPIVAVSVGGRDAHDASLAAGADLFLDKPLAFRDLFNTLRVLALSGDLVRRSKEVVESTL